MEKFDSVGFLDQDGSSNGEEGKLEKEKRQTWSSQLDFIMATVGCAVGLGNIWRFPYLCYKNGGGAFFIPYLTAFFFVAAPMFLLEISIGQYTSSGCIHAWDIVPAFRGIGYAGQIVLGYSNIYYIIVLVWALYYFYVSLRSELPWDSCGNIWNTERCFVSDMDLNVTACNSTMVSENCSSVNTSSLKRVDAVVEYWENGVLQMSSGIDEPGRIVPGLAIALIVAWVMVFFCVFRGVKWTGKLVYVTALVPYLLLTALLVRGLTLEGSVDGIIYFLKPDVSRLSDARVWMDGGTQVLYSIGIGQGYMFGLGSYNKFHDNCFRNCLIILSVNSLTSIYGGLAVFSILGFMAHETGESIATVVAAGPGLVFQTYPKAASQMPLPPVWSALFFLTIIFVGLDSVFVSVEGFLTTVVDWFPNVFYKPRNKTILTAVYCVACGILGLTLITQGGVYLFRLIDNYSVSGLVLLLICTMESVTVGWIFGAERYYDALEMMTGLRYTPWMKWCWKFIVPVIVQAIFWFEVVTFKPLTFSAIYDYPSWATGLGVIFMLSSTLCIPLVLLYNIVSTKGSLIQRWRKLTTPVLKPHQIHPSWKEKGYRWYLKGHDDDL